MNVNVVLALQLIGTAATTRFDETVAPPHFGHALRDEFLFGENVTQMNHGAYGATPKKVLDAQFVHIKDIESDITKWYHMEMPGNPYKAALLAVRQRIAAYINSPEEDTVLVDNASNAINVLLKRWVFEPNEVLLEFSTAHGPFQAFYSWLSATRGVEIVKVGFAFPLSGPEDILAALNETLSSLRAQGKSASVAVVSQVSSCPAVILPVERIVRVLREAGIPSIVDGAHALGAVEVDVRKMAPDFWFGNGHKWLYTPKSVCVLYVSKPYQGKYWPEPTVVDSFGDAFTDRFIWSGTRDRSTFLTVPDALDFRQWVGGEVAVRSYIQQLSRDGAALLVNMWNRRGSHKSGLLAPDSMQGTMHNVIVPTDSKATCEKLGRELVDTYKFQIFAMSVDSIPCYVRAHAQIYLTLDDYRRLGELVLGIIDRIVT